MAKKLALVVHGIGEQQAGETLDALVGGLTGDRACTVENELRHLREQDRDHPADEDCRDKGLYPCHIRRVKRGGDETVFAEAFWGDISRGSTGQVRGLIDLFELIMGLGHIIRENAAEIYDDPKARPRRAANFFVYLVHGPITTFNVAIALATALLFLFQWQFGQKDWAASAAMLTAASVLSLCFAWFNRPKRSYLYQIYRSWFAITAVIVVAIVGLSHLIDLLFDEDTKAAIAKALVSQCEIAGAFSRCYDYWYAAVFSNILGAIVALAICLVVYTGWVEAWRRFRANKNASKALYPQAMALLLTVWLFIVVTIWVAVSSSVVAWASSQGIANVNTAVMEKGLLPAQNFTFWVTCALGSVAAGAFLAWLNRKRWTGRVPPKTHLDPPTHLDDPILRLILHPAILTGLSFAIVFIGIGAIEAGYIQIQLATADAIPTVGPQTAGYKSLTYYQTLEEYNISTKFGTIFPLVAAGIALAYTYFRSYLAMGIGIAKDIVVYFVRRPAPRVTDLRGLNVHPLRNRIQDRLVETLILLLRSENPDEVVIVSHSQGTVISVEALRGGRLRAQMQAQGIAPFDIDLVTMGSPTSHLYGFYFTKEFDLKSTDPSKDVTDGIASWLNIYRVDDFVGTTVEGPREDFPKNEWVPAEGHTGYWTDDSVLRHLKRHSFPEFSGREI